MNAKLVVVGGDAKATEVRLRLPTVVGRGREASLTLPHPLVSRRHCEIFQQDGRLMVRDLGSLNGTFIANQRITEAPLPPGELLTIGTVTFRAVYDAPEDAAAEDQPSATPAAGQPLVVPSDLHEDVADQLPPTATGSPLSKLSNDRPTEAEGRRNESLEDYRRRRKN